LQKDGVIEMLSLQIQSSLGGSYISFTPREKEYFYKFKDFENLLTDFGFEPDRDTDFLIL
jgi:hypothetical protein